MARLYANENFPLRAVEVLRALGHDVLTSREAGTAGRGMPDREVLDFARRQARAVLTLNRWHFARLHRVTSVHPVIILCSDDPDRAVLARRIHAALPADLAGQLLRVNRPG